MDMETNLSLIEMGDEEEDESLLLLREDFNKDKKGNSNANVLDFDFSFSPLCAVRSKRSSSDAAHPAPYESEVNEGGKKPSCSSPTPTPSHEGIVEDKENINKTNLLVSPIMKAGQHHMKRRKKGVFNMRKSIAWNRAFLTEEGVLDSEELSLLSESVSKPRAGSLYTIKEEGQTSLSECSISSDNRSNKKKKLIKQSPARPSDEVHKARGGLLPKLKSPARVDTAVRMQGVSQKVQSTKGIHRVGSRQGSCPQPMGSTSQKQLPSRIMASATKKESKLPKISAPKTDSSSVHTAPKTSNLSAKQSRSTQNGATVSRAGKNYGLKGNLSNAKKPPSSTSSSTKSSVRSSLKTMANSNLGKQLSATPKILQGKKGTNIGLKVAPDPTVPAIDMQATIGQAGSGKMAVLSPQNSQYVMVDNRNNVNFPPMKPSGLRMPSPSLRYFDQSKASTLRGYECQKNTQLYNHTDANVPNLKKVGKSVNVHLPIASPDVTTTRTFGHSSSSNIDEVKLLDAQSRLPMVGSSAASNSDAVSMNSVLGCSIPSMPASSHPTPKSSLELKNQNKVETEVPSQQNGSYDTINCQGQQSHGFSDYSYTESPSLAAAVKSTLDKIDHIPCDNKQKFHVNNNMLLIKSGSPEQSHSCDDHENHHEGCPQNSFSSSSASEISHASAPSISIMSRKGVFSRKEGLIKHPKSEGVALESISCNSLNVNHDLFSETVLSYDTECQNPGTSMPSADCLPADHGIKEELARQLEGYEFNQIFHNDNLKNQVKVDSFLGQRAEEFQEENGIPTESHIEQNLHMNYKEVEMNDNTLVAQGRSSDEPEEVNNHHHVSDVNPESRDSDGTGFGSSCFSPNLSSVSHVQVGNPGTENIIKILNVEMNDNTLVAQGRSSEKPEEVNNHHRVSDVNPESRDSDGTGFGSSCFSSNLSSVSHVQVGNPGTENIIKISNVEDPQLQDVISNCNTGSMLLHNDCLRTGEEYSGKQSVPRNSIPNEIEQMLQTNEHALLMDEILPAEKSSSVEPQKDNDPDIFSDITLKRKDFNTGESQSLHVLSQLNFAIQTAEGLTEMSEVTEQSHMQDAAQLNLSASRNVVLDATNSDPLHNDNSQDGGELQPVTDNEFLMKVNETSLPVEEKAVDGSKPDSLPQQNVIPFSEEWLAALETAGEEILTRKSGAVQNSPPDKSLPEPNPWSPVRRKSNQEIGPFDCTKFTNLPSSPN